MDASATEWLDRLGLGLYADVFAENDVDMRALPHLAEADLRELGVSLGHRKILLVALAGFGAELASEPVRPVDAELPAAPAGPEDHAEHRLLSVLFADVVGSTELSRQLDAEAMREALRGFQDAVAGVVSHYGGYVAKYLGDGALAYFGWPMAYEDHAERALHAGLEIIAALGEVRPAGGAPLAGRVGIATGRVVVGDLVSAGGTELGAIAGDTPNLAARLQAVADPGEVVVGSATRGLVGDAFVLESLGPRRLKGYDEDVEAHRVVAAREVDSRFEALRAAGQGDLVGRVHEKGMLMGCWQAALGGKGRLALISGDAGIGKSRLVEALAEEVARTPHELVRLQCSPYHTASAFHPVIERVTRIAGIRPDDAAEARVARIRAMLGEAIEAPAQAVAVYTELLSIERGADRDELSLSPQDLKELTIQTLVQRIVGLARGKPVLMVVEDSHWIDPSTQEVLERLAAAIADLPIMLVVTQRPEGASEWVRGLEHATLLSVGMLDREQTAALVAGILGETPGEALIDVIESRSGGVPLFVEELARSVAELGASDGGQAIPETLQGSLMARLDRLSPGAKNVALVASVIGREFDVAMLERVLGGHVDALGDHLRELARARIIVASGATPGIRMFRHALVQDTAYQSLLSRTRRAHHLAVARELEGRGDDTLEQEPELVARHFSEAGVPDIAIGYWTKAAERALARSANFEAVSHAQAAFAHLGRLPDDELRSAAAISTGILLGRALESAGKLREACAEHWRAAERARAAGDFSGFVEAVVLFSGALFVSSSPVDPSIALLEEALQWAPPDDDEARCQLLSTLARGCLTLGDARAGARHTRAAIGLVRRLDDSESLFSLLISEFLTPVGIREAVELGSWRAKLDDLIAVAETLDDSARGRARSVEIFISAEMGDRDGMDHALARLQTLGAARQHMHLDVVATFGLAMQAMLDGDFGLAEKFTHKALEGGRQTYGQSLEGVYGMQMFTIRREQGRLAEVAPMIRRMLDDAPEDAAWKPGFAIVASDLGHVDAAGRMLREIAETDFAFALDAKYSTTLAYLAEVCAAAENRDLAERLHDLLHPYQDMTITAGVNTACLGAAARHLGLLCTTMGEWERAEGHFEAAIAMNRRMRAPPWTAWAQHDHAAMLLRRGRPQDRRQIRALAREALDAATELGMVTLRDSCAARLL